MHQNIQWVRIIFAGLTIVRHLDGLSPTICGLFLLSVATAHIFCPIDLKICTQIHDGPDGLHFMKLFWVVWPGGEGHFHIKQTLPFSPFFRPIELKVCTDIHTP